jgi:ribonuclease Z
LKFELNILGSGSSAPTLYRNPTSQVLNVNENLYMIDCAEGTQVQLRKFRVKFQKINHVFISHLHGDHYLGLIGFIQSMHLLGRKTELHIYAHPELQNIVQLHNKVSETYLKYPIRFHSLTYNEKVLIHEDSKTRVYSFPLKHRIPTCGFLFEEKEREKTISKQAISDYNIPVSEIRNIKCGADFCTDDGKVIPNNLLTLPAIPPRRFAFCSDTVFDESIVPYIENVDLLYHEATFLSDLTRRAKETFHSTAYQAASLAKMANARKLLIGHFSVRYKNADDFLTEAQAIYRETIMAQDGMKISI